MYFILSPKPAVTCTTIESQIGMYANLNAIESKSETVLQKIHFLELLLKEEESDQEYGERTLGVPPPLVSSYVCIYM